MPGARLTVPVAPGWSQGPPTTEPHLWRQGREFYKRLGDRPGQVRHYFRRAGPVCRGGMVGNAPLTIKSEAARLSEIAS